MANMPASSAAADVQLGHDLEEIVVEGLSTFILCLSVGERGMTFGDRGQRKRAKEAARPRCKAAQVAHKHRDQDLRRVP